MTREAVTSDTPPETGEAPAGTRIFSGTLFRVRVGNGWAFTEEPPMPPPETARRPARVAQSLALAHRIEAAIERGDYRDRADVARQLGFTRARVTQILDLTLLAPNIQEEIVFLEAVDGVEPLSERALRRVVCHASWVEQRLEWSLLCLGLIRQIVLPRLPQPTNESGHVGLRDQG